MSTFPRILMLLALAGAASPALSMRADASHLVCAATADAARGPDCQDRLSVQTGPIGDARFASLLGTGDPPTKSWSHGPTPANRIDSIVCLISLCRAVAPLSGPVPVYLVTRRLRI